jgi:catechol 2,3-dioxygenase-like lactoylglutathione lyase family enzyme
MRLSSPGPSAPLGFNPRASASAEGDDLIAADLREDSMEQRLSLVTLGVADVERSRRFYEDGLGWRRGNRHQEVVFFQLPGMVLALFSRVSLAADAGLPPEAAGGFGGVALAYNARSRDEVDATMAEAETAGARILKPAQDAFWGGYSGYFADPDGHLWEVAWNPEWELDAEGRVSLTYQT